MQNVRGVMAATFLAKTFHPVRSDGARLFLISFLLLFFELVCIRWVPSYVRYLSFFTNFILLACFLGMGVGLLTAGRRASLLSLFPGALLLFVGIVSQLKFEMRLDFNDVIYFSYALEKYRAAESYLVLPVVFILTSLLFMLLGQEMGRLFDAFKPLRAYGLNIGGSILGVLAFMAMSFLSLPPVWWFLLCGLLTLLLLRCPLWVLVLNGVLLGSTCGVVLALQKDSMWSPYYRVTVNRFPNGIVWLNVNNIGHQAMLPHEEQKLFYRFPYTQFRNNHFRNVLVIGAGSGTDVSSAIYHGAEKITAVEIDPLIQALGARLHPLKPYSDPRVTVHINDARTFLRNSREKFDLIIYALPDSLTLTSSFANLRLESYLFTVESFRDARRLLADDGALILYNFYREGWLVEKIAVMLKESFGSPPVVIRYLGGNNAVIFMAGGKLRDLKTPLPGFDAPSPIRPATDDWPFLYMKEAFIPPIFLLSLLMIAAFSFVTLLIAAPAGTLRRVKSHFFFLGAAFMLLETTSVVRFSLLFGSTWLVNSLVFLAVLLVVLVAVKVSASIRIRRMWILYLLLAAALALNYFLPLKAFLSENAVLRFIIPSLLIFSPIFLANLIFTQSFRHEEGAAAIAAASNILGSFFGGMLEYASLATGYRNLFILVGLFYLLSFLPLLRKRPGDREDKATQPS